VEKGLAQRQNSQLKNDNSHGRVSEKEYLKWIDIELTGEGWITLHKVNHPDLGRI
jgi:hypothetical protein